MAIVCFMIRVDCVSHANLGSSSSFKSPVICFRLSSGLWKLECGEKSDFISARVHTSEIFSVDSTQPVVIYQLDSETIKKNYRGILIGFKGLNNTRIFHDTFESCKKKVAECKNAEGSKLSSVITSDSQSKFDAKTDKLFNQQTMLQNYIKTGSYYNAVMSNRADFDGRIVVDVGAGIGVLSLCKNTYVKRDGLLIYRCEKDLTMPLLFLIGG